MYRKNNSKTKENIRRLLNSGVTSNDTIKIAIIILERNLRISFCCLYCIEKNNSKTTKENIRKFSNSGITSNDTTKIAIIIIILTQRQLCTIWLYNNLDFSFSSSLVPAACPPSLFVILSTHAFPLRVLVSSSVSLFYCQVAQLLYWCFHSRYVSIRIIAVFVVSFMCRMCLVTFLFYRSNSSRSPLGDRSLSSSFSSASHSPVHFPSPLPSLGFYRRRPGGIVKTRHPMER